MRTRWGYGVGLMALVVIFLTACGGSGEDWPLLDEALAMAGADEWLDVESSGSDGADERAQVVDQGGPGGL